MPNKYIDVKLIIEGDSISIQETLYLQLLPGLIEDVKAGRKQANEYLFTRDDLPW